MSHKYPNFEKATKLATHLLYHQNVSDRVLNVENLVYDRPVYIDSLQNYSMLTRIPVEKLVEKKSPTSDGVCLYDNKTGLYVILYNAFDKNLAHRNWTIAHEIGHVYMEHKADGEIEEIETNFFAAQLFMPEYTLLSMSKEYGMFDCYDLMEIFGVSKQAAEKRIETFERKKLFNASKKDVAIWQRQKKKIDLYYKCKQTGEDFRFALDMENADPYAEYYKENPPKLTSVGYDYY